MRKLIILMGIVFMLGWAGNSLYDYYSADERPHLLPYLVNSERISPSDWVKEDQILVYDDYIVINVKDAYWAKYANTNSMDPLLDEDSNGLEIMPESKDDLHVGDIISYYSEPFDSYIVHRIVRISEDRNGWYAITKGDNSTMSDPVRVRFEDVNAVLIGVIY